MSRRTRNIRRKKQKLEDIKERIEFETDVYFLESLKLELKHAKKHEILQKRIHKKQGWRSYTC
jgi:hypothetical protein